VEPISETNTDTLSITAKQPTRLWLLHPDARRRAFTIRARRNARYQGQAIAWHVGISSSRIVMLDIDTPPEKHDAYVWTAKGLAYKLANMLNCPVAIYDSGAGYWLVGLKPVEPETWKSAYRWAVVYGHPFDQIHAEASLKWNRTTLRVSDKGNGHRPIKKVLEVIPN